MYSALPAFAAFSVMLTGFIWIQRSNHTALPIAWVEKSMLWQVVKYYSYGIFKNKYTQLLS